jgi:peroxiredoxin Q/BCP
VAREYGAKRPGPLFNRRATFVIGGDRRLLAVIRSETNMERHADEALSALRKANLPSQGGKVSGPGEVVGLEPAPEKSPAEDS